MQHFYDQIILDLFIIHGYDVFDTDVSDFNLTLGIGQRFKQHNT
jgi:hypothetical protein